MTARVPLPGRGESEGECRSWTDRTGIRACVLAIDACHIHVARSGEMSVLLACYRGGVCECSNSVVCVSEQDGVLRGVLATYVGMRAGSGR